MISADPTRLTPTDRAERPLEALKNRLRTGLLLLPLTLLSGGLSACDAEKGPETQGYFKNFRPCGPLDACDLDFDRALEPELEKLSPIDWLPPSMRYLHFYVNYAAEEKPAIAALFQRVSDEGPLRFQINEGETSTRYTVQPYYEVVAGRESPVSARNLFRTEGRAPGIAKPLINVLLSPFSRITLVANGLSPLAVELLHLVDLERGYTFRDNDPERAIRVFEAIDLEALSKQLWSLDQSFETLTTRNPFEAIKWAFNGPPSESDPALPPEADLQYAASSTPHGSSGNAMCSAESPHQLRATPTWCFRSAAQSTMRRPSPRCCNCCDAAEGSTCPPTRSNPLKSAAISSACRKTAKSASSWSVPGAGRFPTS